MKNKRWKQIVVAWLVLICLFIGNHSFDSLAMSMEQVENNQVENSTYELENSVEDNSDLAEQSELEGQQEMTSMESEPVAEQEESVKDTVRASNVTIQLEVEGNETVKTISVAAIKNATQNFTGSFQKKTGTQWMEISKKQNQTLDNLSVEINTKNWTVSQLISAQYRFVLKKSSNGGTSHSPNVESDSIYLIDYVGDGFHDWLVNKYQKENNITVSTKQQLNQAIEAFKNSSDSNIGNSEEELKIKNELFSIGINVDLFDGLYYENIKKDSSIPASEKFTDAKSFYQRIIEKKASSDEEAVSFYKKYIFDLMDPNLFSGEVVKKPDYEDSKLSSPSDSKTPFHNEVKATVNKVSSSNQTNSSYFEELKKTVTPDNGENNKEREYEVEVTAQAKGTQRTPLVMLIQVQNSWSMFDIAHANAISSGVKTTQMANLYDIKQALIEFNDKLQEQTDGSVLVAISNFQNKSSNQLLASPYISNDYSGINTALSGWDTFGDSKRVVYSTEALKKATSSLDTVLNNWKTEDGEVIGNQAKVISVVIGGASDSCANGKQLLSETERKKLGIEQQYGIRTNYSNSACSSSKVSWMDYQKSYGLFTDSKYGYQVAYTQKDVLGALNHIYEEMGQQSNATSVEEAVLTDTISNEFDVKKESIAVEIASKSGEVKSVNLSDDAIKLEVSELGTTTITCKIGKVSWGDSIRLVYEIQAKEDYIGGNQVYIGDKLAELSYKSAIGTIEKQTYTQDLYVNVPIVFSVNNGGEIKVEAGQKASLEEAEANKIVEAVETSIKKYKQISGTLTYQWIDDSEHKIGEARSVIISRNREVVYDGEFPDFSQEVTPEKDSTYFLEVTFTPDSGASNQCELVNKRTEKGEVAVWVTRTGKLIINKKVLGSNAPKSDSFIIHIISDESNHSAYETYVKIKAGESITLEVPYGIYQIQETVPMDYELVSMEGTKMDGNGGSVAVTQEDQEINVSITNQYERKGFFHSIESMLNIMQ